MIFTSFYQEILCSISCIVDIDMVHVFKFMAALHLIGPDFGSNSVRCISVQLESSLHGCVDGRDSGALVW